VLLLKIYDRENNLSDLENLSPHKQIRMSFETQAIYFPLRDILKIKETDSILEIESVFKKFLKNNEIKNEKEFKKFLFKKSYRDLNKDVYDIIYKNSAYEN
jgi:(p)ppGpp synthase/HD superfamily hydrolase